MDWIQRSQNDKTDFISNVNDVDDLGVSNQIFAYYSTLWGPFNVDWLASDSNHKVFILGIGTWNVLALMLLPLFGQVKKGDLSSNLSSS